MGMSNYIPSSALTKAGVCTSSARPASPYDGQVIYETDTDRTLVWNNSAWVFLSTSTANPVGLELITSVGCSAGGTASNGVVTIGSAVSSVVVTNAFNANYDSYRIVVSGGSASASTGYLTLQLGSATSNYRYQYIFGTLSNILSTTGTVTGARFDHVGVAGPLLAADIFLTNPFAAGATTINCFAGKTGNDAGPFTGFQVDTTSFTSFTLGISNSNTMTGGTIRVYGLRNS